MLIKKIIPLFTALLLIAFLGNSQVTTSSLSGVVRTTSGAPMVGATITATHTPTGTVYTSLTRQGGRFEMSNLNPGGPYTVRATYVGSEPQVRNEVFLILGESAQLDFDLSESAKELAGVTITGTKAAGKTGAETTINKAQIENLPTVGRTLSDYLRAVPQFKVSGGQNPSGEGGMSFAGQNVRYNSFYIDGAVNNDVFGLAYTGTNGGQTGIAPISIDAIDQFQVSVSPYNAMLGNFTGAAINAITKSGTNEFHGSAYYIFRNEKLTGKSPVGPKDSATRVADFTAKTYGLTFGGPIVKNKIFYFISAEMQRDLQPSIFSLNTYQGNTKDAATIQRLVDTIAARSNGFNVGGYTNNTGEVKSDRLTAKIDWNINPKNKLSLSYRYNSGDKVTPLENGPTLLRFETNGFTFPSKTHSASAELKSNIGSKNKSNRLLLTITDVEDDRAPIGSANPIPLTQIFDGPVASINFGTEASSTFNYLKQTTINILDQFKFNIGKNYLTVGVEAETYHAFNSFIQNTVGNYRYDSLSDFFANKRPNRYIVNYPNFGGTEQNTESAADFDIFKGAAFINDEIRVNKNLTVTLGLRADYYKFLTDPILDTFARDSAMPKIMAFHDVKGARPGFNPSIPVALSPRVGFTYLIPSENITIRGGFGWFTGRIPLVWPSAIYNNNGLAQGGYTLDANQNAALRDQIKFRITPYSPQEIGLSLPNSNLSNAKGTLVIISEEFKMPKVFRTSLAIDKRWGKGWSTTLEGMVTRNVNDVYYRNINLLPPTLRMASGPDTRMVYPASNVIPIRAGTGANPYQAVYLITNADGLGTPFSYNFTFSVNKSTRTGFNLNFNYNFGESQVLNEAQSSTPGSQWNGMETINGRNNITLSQSDNSVGHRIFTYLSKKFTYANKKLATTISLTYTGQSGQPFTYVYSGTAPTRDGVQFADLIYIPTATELQAMTFVTGSGVTAAPDVQKAAFEQYIQNDKYLRNHRGQYAERNSNRAPFQNIVDLKIAQNFNVKVAGKTYTAEVAYSMFNFTNFLNRDWGRQFIVNFDTYSLLAFSYTSTTNLTPRYTFNPQAPKPWTLYNRFNPTYSPRWVSQLEFRVKF